MTAIVRRIFLVASLLVPTVSAQAFPCPELVSELWTTFWPDSPKTQIVDWNEKVKLGDYYTKGGMLLDQLNARLTEMNRGDLVKALEGMRYFMEEDFFRHAYQNTVQHGSEALLNRDYEYSVDVRTEVLMSERELAIEISNPQVKNFPNSLRRKVFAGTDLKVPKSEREGFRGLGVAVRYMSADLLKLPKHTYLEWKADGKRVTFRLVFRIADLLDHVPPNRPEPIKWN